MSVGPMMALAGKDALLILRDRRTFVLLLGLPVLFVAIMGYMLGEGFGQRPDDRLRLTLLIEDQGFVPGPNAEESVLRSPAAGNLGPSSPTTGVRHVWSDVLLRDLEQAADLRVELASDRRDAEQLIRGGSRAAVIILGPQFSERLHQCSFLPGGINPFHRDGLSLELLDIHVLRDVTQTASASILEQVIQVSVLRVVVPWMIGNAFETVGRQLGIVAKAAIRGLFPEYEFSAKTWVGLNRQDKSTPGQTRLHQQITEKTTPSTRYQLLVPGFSVMFAYFVVLIGGWQFLAERRLGTSNRLALSALTPTTYLLGKGIPCLGLSLFQGLTLLMAGRLIFGLDWGPRPDLLLIVNASIAFSAASMSLMVGASVRSESQLTLYGPLLLFLLAIASGCLVPRSLMTETAREWSRVTPHAWALDAYGQLMLSPHPYTEVIGMSCLTLLGFSCIFLFLARVMVRLP